jgi:hypothetical protein
MNSRSIDILFQRAVLLALLIRKANYFFALLFALWFVWCRCFSQMFFFEWVFQMRWHEKYRAALQHHSCLQDGFEGYNESVNLALILGETCDDRSSNCSSKTDGDW